MSIIVTAASGQLGHLTVEALLDRGVSPDNIVATSREVSKLSSFASRGVTTATLDFAEPETISAVIGSGDTVILISSDAVGQRLLQHSAVVDAAKAVGAARIIYTSAPKATTSELILAPEHKATEEYIAESGIPATILRNGWYTENYVSQIGIGRTTGELTASVGEGRVASASRSDYAEAAAAAAVDETTVGRTFELSGDHAWNFDELAAVVSGIVGKPVKYRALTPQEHAEQLRAAGLDEGTISFVVGLDQNIRDGLLAPNSGELAALIGHPTVRLADGLRAAQA